MELSAHHPFLAKFQHRTKIVIVRLSTEGRRSSGGITDRAFSAPSWTRQTCSGDQLDEGEDVLKRTCKNDWNERSREEQGRRTWKGKKAVFDSKPRFCHSAAKRTHFMSTEEEVLQASEQFCSPPTSPLRRCRATARFPREGSTSQKRSFGESGSRRVRAARRRHPPRRRR